MGGGRSHAPFPYEFGVTNDSELNSIVSKFLHGFLASNFPSIFRCAGGAREQDGAVQASGENWWNRILGRDVVESRVLSLEETEKIGVVEEWSGIMGFTLTHAPFVRRCSYVVLSFIFVARHDGKLTPR